MKVKIRFNTNYPKDSDKKWRVIVGDVGGDTEHLVDAVEVLCKTFTTEDIVVLDGEKVLKHHISCKPKSVSLVTAKGIVKAKIK